MTATEAQLTIELKEANNLLLFETNKHHKQLQGLKIGLIAKVHKDIAMELEGINAIVNTLPQEQGESLRRWIINLTQVINNL